MASRSRPCWSVRSLVRVLILSLVGLLAISVVIAVVGRERVSANIDNVRDRLLPASTAISNLGRAVADQDLDRRGYLLSGDSVDRRRLTASGAAERSARRQVGRLLTDARSGSDLVHTDAAIARWRAAVPDTALARRAGGPLPAAEIDALTLASDRAYGMFRVQIRALRDHAAALMEKDFQQVADDQRLASVLVGVIIAVALLTAGVAAVVLRRRVTRPTQQLVDDVSAVAAGEYGHRVPPRGARELREIAEAVDTMRNSILDYAAELAGARASRAQQVEQRRLSVELHDNTLRRLFGLGLTLQSMALRHPELRRQLEPLVDATDEMIREMRRIIFDLRADGTDRLVVADA